MVGEVVGWLLGEGGIPACCGGSEAGERRSERMDTAYSPRLHEEDFVGRHPFLTSFLAVYSLFLQLIPSSPPYAAAVEGTG